MFKLNGRYPRAWQLLPLLGFSAGGHLPPEGFAPRQVNGSHLRCVPATAGRRKHRIEYHCGCGRWVPYGRAGQHSAACKYHFD